jgi:hypothetical protein
MGMLCRAHRARVNLALFISVAILCGFRCSLPWSSVKGGNISIVSYNAHNFFDARDEGSEYPEFSVKNGRWNEKLYRVRLENLARAVLSFFPSGKESPEILCLEEIESIQVLKDLASGPLKSGGYGWLGIGGPEDSPIKSGFLSRIPAFDMKSHTLSDSWGMGAGREIVEISFDLARPGSTIPAPATFFICHWKSRKEGVEVTEPMRREASRLIAGRISELARTDPGRPIICLGDFNESPDEFERNDAKFPVALMPSPDSREFGDLVSGIPGEWFAGVLRLTGDGRRAFVDDNGATLYSPWFSSPGYSYRFEGRAERLDGFLLSPGLFDGRGLEFRGFQAADDPLLMDAEGNPLGWNGASGFSDHLPILLDLEFREDSALK